MMLENRTDAASLLILCLALSAFVMGLYRMFILWARYLISTQTHATVEVRSWLDGNLAGRIEFYENGFGKELVTTQIGVHSKIISEREFLWTLNREGRRIEWNPTE